VIIHANVRSTVVGPLLKRPDMWMTTNVMLNDPEIIAAVGTDRPTQINTVHARDEMEELVDLLRDVGYSVHVTAR
jgi:hypothetical protein